MSLTTSTSAGITTVKLSMRIDSPLWTAWSKLSRLEGYDPLDHLRMMMISVVTKADPPVLQPEENLRLQRLDRLIRKVVKIATEMFRNGEFSEDITLRVFQQAMRDDKFATDYKTHIGNTDPYTHGNPLKEVNRELGWRIKNSMPVKVIKNEDGKPAERRNLKGEVIQSYTLLALRDED